MQLSCHLRWVADRLGSARGGGQLPSLAVASASGRCLVKCELIAADFAKGGRGGGAGRAPNSLARLCRDFVSTLRTSPALPRLYRDFADFADFSGSADFAGFADFADFADFRSRHCYRHCHCHCYRHWHLVLVTSCLSLCFLKRRAAEEKRGAQPSQ